MNSKYLLCCGVLTLWLHFWRSMVYIYCSLWLTTNNMDKTRRILFILNIMNFIYLLCCKFWLCDFIMDIHGLYFVVCDREINNINKIYHTQQQIINKTSKEHIVELFNVMLFVRVRGRVSSRFNCLCLTLKMKVSFCWFWLILFFCFYYLWATIVYCVAEYRLCGPIFVGNPWFTSFVVCNNTNK